MSFRALVIDRKENGKISQDIREMEDARLPAGDVTVAVEWSSLNYKDGLCLAGKGGLVREFPHVAGIDLAGTVETSDAPEYRPGDKVLLTGWRVGETHWGGYATKARLRSEWLVKLPEGLSTRRAMAVGTAGFTAMLAVMALESHGLETGQGPVLVTGASGGVGSIAVMILASLGFEVTAVTGKQEEEACLLDFGATNILPRADLADPPTQPLESETWAGAVDAVGGTTLARLLTQMKYGCSVAAVGLAGGAELPATVIPFVLRGINLLGIDSVMQPKEHRIAVWERIARDLDMEKLDALTSTAGLADLPRLGAEILKGQIAGRVVIDPSA